MNIGTGEKGELLRVRGDAIMVAPLYLECALLGVDVVEGEDIPEGFSTELQQTFSEKTGIDEHDHDAIEALLESEEGVVPFISLPYTPDRLTELQRLYNVGLNREIEILFTEPSN